MQFINSVKDHYLSTYSHSLTHVFRCRKMLQVMIRAIYSAAIALFGCRITYRFHIIIYINVYRYLIMLYFTLSWWSITSISISIDIFRFDNIKFQQASVIAWYSRFSIKFSISIKVFIEIFEYNSYKHCFFFCFCLINNNSFIYKWNEKKKLCVLKDMAPISLLTRIIVVVRLCYHSTVTAAKKK